MLYSFAGPWKRKTSLDMLLFLDTEYTGYEQAAPQLISLALVTEDGKREFYVEIADTWRVADCTEFVKREVLPLLDGPRRATAPARAELRAWLAESPRKVQAACDSATDFNFLLDLLGSPRAANLASTYFDLRPLIDTTVYDRSVAAHYDTDRRLHHALADARAYRRGWLAWMDARKAGSGKKR
ncbi:3'-5' exoribonuclease [Paraburkholderia sp. FT54]|uniref:3'-5' exoribonuclease n=1 Tax=Paraburkholderia sp. FT54 TaxID=3074437 RepID=UPI0028777ADE|nr:3'-5' exoribonuclease [Paraburkholderia sp. FT54]WNC94390.1 3'-5' exoribonuclease [Paraburkholderia sp. FT54]